MIGYELRKLLGFKFLCLSFVTLFVLNGILCFVSLKDFPYQSKEKKDIDTLFQLYYEDPLAVNKNYDSYCELSHLNDLAWRESIENNTDATFSRPIPANTMSDLLSDAQLYRILFETVDYVKNYHSMIDDLINESKSNLSELKSSSSYAHNYQIDVINAYTNTKNNVLIGLEYRSGWDTYFSYYTGDIFVFIIMLIISSLTFSQEISRGSLSIIYSSKKGRIPLAIAKIFTVYLSSTFTVILFSLESFLIIWVQLGYSNPQNALQFLPDFLYSPFPISIITFFVIRLLLKILVFILFSSIIIAISILIKKQSFIYIIGISFFGVNFLFYKFSNINSLFKHFNIISMSYVTAFFDRFRAVNIFGTVVSYDVLLPIVLISMIISISVFSVLIFNFNQSSSNNKSNLHPNFRTICYTFHQSSTPKHYPTYLIPYEFFKILISSKFIIIIFAVFVAEFSYTFNSSNTELSQSDIIYQEYMFSLEGEYTLEKKEFITQERIKINNVLAQYNEKQTSFTDGKLQIDELKAYLNDYNYAINHTEPLERIETQVNYLSNLNEKNISAWFIYDTGWKHLLNPSIDWLLLIILILIITHSFSIEYDNRSSSGSFSHILKTTRNGRKLTWKTKYWITIVIAFSLTCLWNVLDFASIFLFYELPCLSAPIISIPIFESFPHNLTIIQYLIFLYIFKLFASILFACFICSLSSLLKSPISTMSTTVIITMLPKILSMMGLPFLSHIDFTKFLCVTPIFIDSSHPLIFCTIIVSICIITITLSERAWTQ